MFLIPVYPREPRITAGEICGAVVGPGCGRWEDINDWTVDIPAKPFSNIAPSKHPKTNQEDVMRYFWFLNK